MEGLAGYIVRRLLFLPVTLLVVSFAAFTIARLGPGDPVSIYSGQFRDEEALDRVRKTYGLDKPIVEQYGIYMERLLLHADPGPSFQYRDRDITEVLKPKIWVSFRLVLYASILVFLVGIPVGVFAAVKQGTWLDPFIISIFLFFQSIPVLVAVPIMVVVLAANLHWVPPGGFDGIFTKSMIIPTLAMSLPGIAGIARLSRILTLATLHEDFVRTARAKGIDELTIITRHVARNSLVPVMTTSIGLSLVGLVEGTLFVERLLGIPGVGLFMFEAIGARDYNVVLAFVLLVTTLFILANLLVDLALIVIDPRVRATGLSPR